MAKIRKLSNGKVKPMGDEMVKLVEEIQAKFREKHGFSPNMTDITNQLARAVRKKGVYVF